MMVVLLISCIFDVVMGGDQYCIYLHLTRIKHQKFISHSSGSCKFKIIVPAWSGSGEDPFLCFRLPNSGCVLLQQRSERGSKLTCDSYMATNEGSILITSAILNQLLQRPPPPKTITLWGRFQLTNLRGHKCSVYNTMLSQ